MTWDDEEWRKLRNKKLLEWFDGNSDAVRCFVDISTIAEIWDDMIDCDVPTGPERINRAFMICTIHLPTNPFYVEHRNMIEPLVIMTVNAWLDSEELVKSKDEKLRQMSFHIRNMGIEIGPMIAFCIGGLEHMRKVSAEMREFFCHESYEEWEHRHVA